MQKSLNSLDNINDLFKRYTDERMLPAFSKFLDEKSIFKINTYTMTDWRTKNQELLESDDAFTSIYLHSNGDLRLSLLFLIDWKNTVSVVQKLLGTDSCSLDLKKSALLETGNILTGSFFNAVTDKTEFTIMPSIPLYSEDTFALLSEILEINFATDEEEAILNEIIFMGDDTGLSIKLIVALDANDANKLS